MSLPLLLPLIASLCLAPMLGGCLPPASNASAEIQALPEYKEPDAKLFDDSIEGYAIGLSLESPSLRGNSQFRARAQAARSIARMRIETVTSGEGRTRTVYRLGLKREGKVLAGKDESDTVEIEVATGAPGFGLIKQGGERIRNKTVVLLWKTFRVNDEAVIHFYVAPDDEETIAAVRDAVALQEVSGKK